MHVQVKPMSNADGRVWLVSINGSPDFQVLDHATQTDNEGNVQLSLILPVDSLAIGEPSKHPEPQPSAPEQAQGRVWGDLTAPDPRSNMPGWPPEKLGEQVAQNVRDAVNRAGRVIA